MVPYVVDAVVAVTMIHVLLFVLHVCMLRACQGARVVAVSAYMGCTCGSGVLSSAGDVLEMNVVRGVGGGCDICMCLARGGLGGVGVSESHDWV